MGVWEEEGEGVKLLESLDQILIEQIHIGTRELSILDPDDMVIGSILQTPCHDRGSSCCLSSRIIFAKWIAKKDHRLDEGGGTLLLCQT
jgi:hypothetical protein